MPLLGIDISHYQGRPNLVAFKNAGGVFVIAKATQGVGYVDSEHDITRGDANAAGLIFGSYHFADWGDPVAEANFFLAHAAPQPGELVALDSEAAIPAGVDVAAWGHTFSLVIEAAVGCAPLEYMNKYWLNGHNWSSVVADNDSLWLASYDNSDVQPAAAGPWPMVSFKQFTSTASEPGVAGQVDADYFFGDLAALEKYTVQGGDMPLNQADLDNIWWSEKVKRDGFPDNPVVQELADCKTLGLDNQRALTLLQTTVAGLTAPAAVNAGAVVAALKADADFKKLLADTANAAAQAAVSGVISAIDADLARRFGGQA
jgi:lysozyme